MHTVTKSIGTSNVNILPFSLQTQQCNPFWKWKILLVIRKMFLYFIENIIICCCHGNQFITYLKCKYLLLMTSHNASVMRLWHNLEYENSLLPSSNKSFVHILVHFDKRIMKRLEYMGNTTVIWRHHYIIHRFKWSMNCHKELSYLDIVNKVFNPRTSKGEGQMNSPPPRIGFSDIKFEAFRQSKWNF